MAVSRCSWDFKLVSLVFSLKFYNFPSGWVQPVLSLIVDQLELVFPGSDLPPIICS